MAEGKFYWLKLKRDFFKRHDIRVIESMPNGKDYVLFYLKLLVESIDHEGQLRFSETIPYNADMLAAITNTNIDIVRTAMKVFAEFGMVEILEDKTIYMAEVQKMIGSAVDNDNANRQRRFREKKKEQLLLERYDDVTKNNESKSKSIDIDIYNPPIIPPKGGTDPVRDNGFDAFWSEYPKKVGKKDAKKAYEKALKSTDAETMIRAVQAQKGSGQWTRDNGRYIPNPSTWLNQGRWDDEIQPIDKPREKPKIKTAPSETHAYDMDELRRRAKE